MKSEIFILSRDKIAPAAHQNSLETNKKGDIIDMYGLSRQ